MTAQTHFKHALPCSLASLLAPSLSVALEIGGTQISVQPRVEAGFMKYSTTQGAGSLSVLSATSGTAANYTQRKVSLEATLPTLGGGLTLFADRFFLDLNGQQTAKASANDGNDYTYSAFIGSVPGSVPGSVAGRNQLDLDADRSEYAVSAGYSITDQIALYAGYKWAKTRFKGSNTGTVTESYYIDGAAINVEGAVEGTEHYTLEYDGPFVGLVYGLSVDRGILDGRLSFNFAAAFLDGDFSNTSSYRTTATKVNGVPVSGYSYDFSYSGQGLGTASGETIGFTFGVGWNGKTGIEGLSYSLGVSGYNYRFDVDEANTPDATETALIFKTGISYAF